MADENTGNADVIKQFVVSLGYVPVSGLYLLAKPNTPAEVIEAVAERSGAGRGAYARRGQNDDRRGRGEERRSGWEIEADGRPGLA